MNSKINQNDAHHQDSSPSDTEVPASEVQKQLDDLISSIVQLTSLSNKVTYPSINHTTIILSLIP